LKLFLIRAGVGVAHINIKRIPCKHVRGADRVTGCDTECLGSYALSPMYGLVEVKLQRAIVSVSSIISGSYPALTEEFFVNSKFRRANKSLAVFAQFKLFQTLSASYILSVCFLIINDTIKTCTFYTATVF